MSDHSKQEDLFLDEVIKKSHDLGTTSAPTTAFRDLARGFFNAGHAEGRREGRLAGVEVMGVKAMSIIRKEVGEQIDSTIISPLLACEIEIDRVDATAVVAGMKK